MRLLLMGGLRLVSDGGAAFERWPTRKAGELVARLATLSGDDIGRDVLASSLWPEAETGVARNRLKATVALLNRSLADTFSFSVPGARHLLPRLLVTTDVADFAWSLKRADRSDSHEAQLPHLEAALGLWRGPFLAGWDSEWIAGERAAWNARYGAVLLRTAQKYAFLERYEEALARATEARTLDPLNEGAAGAVMRLLIRLDRKASALRVFRETQERVRAELGVEPGAELRALAASLHRGATGAGISASGTAALPAEPLDRGRDDAARLLGVLRREGVVGGGEGELRPELLAAASQLAGAMTGPEREALRRRHAAQVATQVREAAPHLRGPRGETYLRTLDAGAAEVAATLNFLTDERPVEALSLATQLHWWWYVRGRYAEGREFLDALLERAPRERGKVRADALLASGHFANCVGDNRTAFGRYRAARSIYRALGDADGVALTQMREGNAAMEEGMFLPARQLCQDALDHFRARGDGWNLILAMFYSYQACGLSGERERAMEGLRDLLGLAESLGDTRYMALSYHSLGMDHLTLYRDSVRGNACVARGLRLLQKQPDVLGAIYTVQTAASALAMRGQLDEAATALGVTAGLRERHGQAVPQAEIISVEVYNAPEALALFGRGIRRAAKARGRDLAVSLLESLAFVLNALGE